MGGTNGNLRSKRFSVVCAFSAVVQTDPIDNACYAGYTNGDHHLFRDRVFPVREQ